MKPESITRIQWGPNGITVYTNYGMHSQFTEKDELTAFTEQLSRGFAAVEDLREEKKKKQVVVAP